MGYPANPPGKKDTTRPIFREATDTGQLRVKERRIVFRFCLLLVIIGISLALITGNQWWLALLLGPFSMVVGALYARKDSGDRK